MLLQVFAMSCVASRLGCAEQHGGGGGGRLGIRQLAAWLGCTWLWLAQASAQTCCTTRWLANRAQPHAFG